MATQEMKAYKKQKRQYKKGWKKATRAPRILAGFSGFLTVVLAILLVLVNLFDQTFYVLTGSSYYELKQGAESAAVDAQYYKSTFASDEERRDYGALICQQLEEEGAVLLKNDNNALPLAEGSKISCFGQTSVDIVYGGTGSGAVDTSSVVSLREALEEAGFQVNPSLWAFYESGAGSEYRRTIKSMRFGGSYTIGEVP